MGLHWDACRPGEILLELREFGSAGKCRFASRAGFDDYWFSSRVIF
jgi:hypothetical protein